MVRDPDRARTQRDGRLVRLPGGGGMEMRFDGIDGRPRHVPVDIDYQPERLDRVPAGLERVMLDEPLPPKAMAC